MEKEIKEILDIERYRNKDGYVENINLLPDEIHKLLDYITRLQENYERIYNENCILRERIKYLERSNNRREDEILSLRQELYGQGSE